MKLMKSINALCGPAYLYLAMSVVALLLLGAQNLFNGNMNQFCAGTFKCNVSNVVLVFVVKTICIVFWTVVLDALCKYGLTNVSWILVLLPFILFFLGFLLMKTK